MTRHQKEAAHLYRDMVRATRAWVQATHPNADRLTLLHEHPSGMSDQLAAFHADVNDDWSRGDMLAMPPRRRN